LTRSIAGVEAGFGASEHDKRVAIIIQREVEITTKLFFMVLTMSN
jgi:hypothetical protein